MSKYDSIPAVRFWQGFLIAILLIMAVLFCLYIKQAEKEGQVTDSVGRQMKDYECKEVTLCEGCAGVGVLELHEDGIALVNVNTVESIELQREDNYTTNIRSWETSRVIADSYGDRGIWELDINIKDSMVDKEQLEEHYCSACAKEMLNNIHYELAIYDFQSHTIYPIRQLDNTRFLEAYYVRTVWQDDDNLEMLVVHTPKDSGK